MMIPGFLSMKGVDVDSVCPPTQTCTPVHKQVMEFLIEHTDSEDDESIFKNGVCSQNPEENYPLPTEDFDFPVPMAHFPLSDGSTRSWPVGYTQGYSVNAEIIDDPMFGK